MLRAVALAVASIVVAAAQPPTTWLGVGLVELSPQKAQELGLDAPGGVQVANIAVGGPAQRAGVMPGEVIVQFGTVAVTGVRQLAELVRATPAGQAVAVELLSARGRRTVEIVLEERRAPLPPRPMADIVVTEPLDFDIPRPVMAVRNRALGATLESLEGQLAEFFGVTAGLLVREVRGGSAAEAAGLRAGDVIVEANRQPVAQADDLRRAMNDAAGEPFELRLQRDRRSRTVSVNPSAGAPFGRPFTQRFQEP